MVQVAIPIWLMIVLGLGLAALLVGAVYGLVVFMRQLVGGEVDFAGTIPVREPSVPPQPNPRLREVDEAVARELMRLAEEDRGPR